LKKYITLYSPFLSFVAKFFLSYIILTLIYQGYLASFDDNQVDSVTKLVAVHTKNLLELFNADVAVEDTGSVSYIKLFYNHKYVARMIEGCNAISIIILFVSFLVSFSARLKTTLLFVFGGSLVLYLLNVVRIALLCFLLFLYPEREPFLHGIFFPLFIYGVVFGLWIIWVNKFSIYAKKTNQV
jgi:exosortase family protein XrtF